MEEEERQSDEARQLLEKLMKSSRSKYQQSFAECRRIFTETAKAHSDFKTYEKAYEAYTRDTDNPYIYSNDTWGEFLAEICSVMEQNTSPAKTSKPPGQPTKIGLVHEIIQTNPDKDWTFEDIIAANPENAPFILTKDDLYRAIPKLANRGILVKTGRGTYRLRGGRGQMRPGLFTEGENM